MEGVKNTVPDFDSVGRMETEGVRGFILDNTRNCDFLSNQGEIMMVITSEPSYTGLTKPRNVLQHSSTLEKTSQVTQDYEMVFNTLRLYGHLVAL